MNRPLHTGALTRGALRNQMELPQVLSGRRINDNMGKFVAENTVKKLIKVGKAVNPASLKLRRVKQLCY